MRDKFTTENPVTLKIIQQYSYFSSAEIEHALLRSHTAQREWGTSRLELRQQGLNKLAEVLRDTSQELARSMALEMGKPIKDGEAEVAKSAACCEYYAENLQRFLLEENIAVTPGSRATVFKEPLGPILAIMPWNFPIWQVVRAMAPILAGGNSFLLKPADLVAGTSLRFCQSVQKVFGESLVLPLLLNHEQTAQVIADRRVAAVTMTGSSRGGREVAATAGRNLKKSVLELGGSDPYLLLEDADTASVALLCARSRMINNGQSCIAAKRFFVPKIKRSEFVEKMAEHMATLRRDDPLNPETDLGPLAHQKMCENALLQIANLEKEGAKRLWCAEEGELSGAFFSPQIFLCSGQEPSLAVEEFFAPVALVHEYENLEQAIAMCNATVYGLGGAVFSRDSSRAETVARQLDCGFVAINDFVRSDQRLPFGGIKDSGFGRELGVWGLNEFVNLKTITSS